MKYDIRSKRSSTSAKAAFAFVGAMSTVATITGYSMGDIVVGCAGYGLAYRVLPVLALFLAAYGAAYAYIGVRYNRSVFLKIQGTDVEIAMGDIFRTEGMRVIAFTEYFDTVVDNVVISKSSLNGQLILSHGDKAAIDALVREAARDRGIAQDEGGRYRFPLGSVIRYDSDVDGGTYLLLALTRFEDNKAYTDFAQYEGCLMRMWGEIDALYARQPVVLPLLGSGITRFSHGRAANRDLLRCMLCTMDASRVALKSRVTVVLWDGDQESKDIPLYEYKDLFRSMG